MNALSPAFTAEVAASMTSPDAELLVRCQHFHRLHAAFYNVPPNDNDDDAVNAAAEAVRVVEVALTRMPPFTHAGVVALAGVALILLEADTECGKLASTEEKLTMAALRGLAGDEFAVRDGLRPIRKVLRRTARIRRESCAGRPVP